MASVQDLIVATLESTRINIRGKIPKLPPHVGVVPRGRMRWAAPWAAQFSTGGILTAWKFGADATIAPSFSHAIEACEGVEAAGQLHEVKPGELGPPVLFEAASYDVYVQASGTIRLDADTPELLTEVNRFPIAGDRVVSHYRLELGNEAGVIGLNVLSTESGSLRRPLARLELEVFPRKLDYQRDYVAMLAAISQAAPGLVFEIAGRTATGAGLSNQPGQTIVEWYQILRATARQLLSAINRIAIDPQRRLEARPRWIPTERARRVAAADLARALRVPGNVLLRASGIAGAAWPRKVFERASVPDLDAEGNRYLAWLIAGVLVRLDRLEGQLDVTSSLWTDTEGGRATAARWHAEVEVLRSQLRRRLAYDFIAQAGEYRGQQPSPTLQAHPLYARAFELGRALLRGLHVDSSWLTDVSVRPVSLLYEYWCFLAIVDLMRKHSRLEACSAIQVDLQGSRIALRRGRAAAVIFRHRHTNKRFRVYYNKTYETPTVAQRPDASIHIESESDIHVFDAKYRVQFDAAYVDTYGGVGPRIDDIGTMHRYRDAIVRAHDGGLYGRCVKSACVLFPWQDSNAYASHSFAKSLDTVGVGGLPFLPTCSSMVAARLGAIVDEAVADAGVRFV